MSTLLAGLLLCCAVAAWLLVCWEFCELAWRVYVALRTAKYEWKDMCRWSEHVGIRFFGYYRCDWRGVSNSLAVGLGRRQLMLSWPVEGDK